VIRPYKKGKLDEFLSLRKSLLEFLTEDIGKGDITSNSIVARNTICCAKIVCKSRKPAIVCGLREAATIFDIYNCKNETLVKDGSTVVQDTVVMTVEGNARSILKIERTVLNLIMRMSGIATETRKFVSSATKYHSTIKIACTRKTAPGLRLFDKKAVSIAGGYPHRMNLHDGVLIKDNHLIINGSISESILLARKSIARGKSIECEVTNTDQAMEALNSGAEIIMLDNFSAESAGNTISRIRQTHLGKKVKIEVSGGITAKNIQGYAKTKPDIISIGHLTHSAKAIDFSLQVF
jgi:nicotinate-nucleotide pyrophosphorylase (carboxylating)